MNAYNWKKWRYSFSTPMADFRSSEGMAPYGYCSDLVGVDGRFVGALRPHPGFNTVANIPVPEGYTVEFTKYVEIQKGSTPFLLRGFFTILKAVAGSTRKWMFYHFDTQRGEWRTYGSPTQYEGLPWAIQVLSNSDVTYSSGFVYICTYDDDFSNYGTHCLWHDGTEFREDTLGSDSYYPSISVNTTGGLPWCDQPTYGQIKDPNDGWASVYLVAYRLGDSRRGVWTPLVYTRIEQAQRAALDDGSQGRIILGNNTSYQSRISITLNWTNVTRYDTIEVYRSIARGGDLYREIFYHVPTEDGVAGGTLADLHGNGPGAPPALGSTGGTIGIWLGLTPAGAAYGGTGSALPGDNVIALVGTMSDDELVTQKQFSWESDDVLEAPSFQRFFCFGSVGLGVKVPESDNTTSAQVTDVAWSNLLDTVPCNFPGLNLFRMPRLSDKIERFLAAGDSILGLASNRIYRFTNVGATMGIERVTHGWGLANRYAACEVGSDAAVLGTSALFLMNGATGAVTTVAGVDRIIQDPDEWAGSLDSVFLVYDSRTSALYLVNTDKDEALLIWGTTNAVTRLVDMPFVSGTSGPHPVTGGQDRAFLVTADGIILEPDAARSAEAPNMMGLTGVELTGTLSGATSGTTLTLSADSGFSNGLSSGFGRRGWRGGDDGYLYVYSDDGGIRRRQITHAGGLAFLLDSALTGVEGEYWSIAPVVFEAVGWPLSTDDDPTAPRDRFRRKAANSMGADLDILTDGESSIPIVLEMYKRHLVTPTVTAVKVALPDDPDRNMSKVAVSGPVLMPGVKILHTGVDFQLLGMTVTGTLDETDKNTVTA